MRSLTHGLIKAGRAIFRWCSNRRRFARCRGSTDTKQNGLSPERCASRFTGLYCLKDVYACICGLDVSEFTRSRGRITLPSPPADTIAARGLRGPLSVGTSSEYRFSKSSIELHHMSNCVRIDRIVVPVFLIRICVREGCIQCMKGKKAGWQVLMVASVHFIYSFNATNSWRRWSFDSFPDRRLFLLARVTSMCHTLTIVLPYTFTKVQQNVPEEI